MKIATICFIIMLASSCCYITDDAHPVNSKNIMTSHDEIRKIMRDYWIHDYETNGLDMLSSTERNELRKMKEDYYYEPSDPNIVLDIPGPGWVIRGPLTITQIEQKSLEEMRESSRKDLPQVPFGFINDQWKKLKSQYKDGDELYFFGSELMRGYVLIHKNKVIDIIVTDIS